MGTHLQKCGALLSCKAPFPHQISRLKTPTESTASCYRALFTNFALVDRKRAGELGKCSCKGGSCNECNMQICLHRTDSVRVVPVTLSIACSQSSFYSVFPESSHLYSGKYQKDQFQNCIGKCISSLSYVIVLETISAYGLQGEEVFVLVYLLLSRGPFHSSELGRKKSTQHT